MKAPYFKLEKKEEDEVLSQIILSDKTPRRYVRTRARNAYKKVKYLWVMSDSCVREAFQRADNEIFNYDELFVLFGKDGLPVCVAVSKSGVLILHNRDYFEITESKAKIRRDPRALYLAYLDMFPQSALDMDAFVSERKKYFLAPENCLYDSVWTATTEGKNKIYFSVNAAHSGVGIWKIRKILFETDKNFQIQTVYSVVGKDCGKYITRAQFVAAGESVVLQLKTALNDFPNAKNIIEEIL